MNNTMTFLTNFLYTNRSETTCKDNRIHCFVEMENKFLSIKCGCNEDFTYTHNRLPLNKPEHRTDYSSNIYHYENKQDKLNILSEACLAQAYSTERIGNSIKFSIDNSTKRGTDLINKLLGKKRYGQGKKF